MRKDHRYGKEGNERWLEITYALLWEWVFISIRSVMPSQNIDRGVKGGKGRLSGNVRETSVVGHKVNHLLLHVLSIIFHPFSSLAEPSGGDHVVTDLRRVLFIIERESPVRWEFIWGELIRNNNFSGRGKGSRGNNWCDSGTSRCLDKRPASRWMVLIREKGQRDSYCEASNLRKKVGREEVMTEKQRSGKSQHDAPRKTLWRNPTEERKAQ